MGLGVAIGGAIGALTIFVMILTYPMISENIYESSDSKKQMNQIENKISRTSLNFKDNIHVQPGVSFVNFSINNNGHEKFWDFDDFHLAITYDGNVAGTKTRLTEIFDYNTAGFSGTSVESVDRGEFKIQRGTAVIAAGAINATLVEGVDFDMCTGDCFVKQVTSRHSGIGPTSGGGSQDMLDFTTFISYDGGLRNAGDDINFTRHSTAADNTRTSWEIWEYIGTASGVNEMKVLDTGICTFGTGTYDYTCGGGIRIDRITTAKGTCTLTICTFSHTVGSGPNRLLVVGVSTPGAGVSSVTYGGTGMTEIRSDDNGASANTSLWYLENPTPGSATVQVNTDLLTTAVMGAISFFDVDTTSPVDVHNGATGTSNNPNVSLTTTNERTWVLDVVSTQTGPISASSVQDVRWNDSQGSLRGGGSTQETIATGVKTMSWTNAGGSQPWAISSVAINPHPGTPIAGVTDDDDVSVFITGQANPNTSNKDIESCLVTSEWDSENDRPIFRRGGVGNDDGPDACDVSYAVLEWSGAYWNVQRIDHEYTDASADQSQEVSISSVNDISQAFFHTQQRNSDSSNDYRKVCASGAEVEITSPTELTHTITFDSGNSAWTNPAMNAVTWIISNLQTDADDKMIVNHYSPVQHPSGGDEEDNWEVGITSLRDGMSEAALTGFSVQTENCDENYPRSFLAARLNSSSTVEFWQSDSNRPNEISIQVTEFPHVEYTNVLSCNGDDSLGVNQWMIGNVTSDYLDPNIWNPGESIHVCSRTQYPIYPTSTITVVLTTDNGYSVNGTRTIP
ncbi:MAG: hypothetical protein DWQ18_00990 [Crenarchaeota archaeon]|nr:MAG: hypothetical protein DWQ17_04225 [Thermoproteota archaeon]RDJ34547.1 MAG: hypothetical protein DWQ18_00990 [Thermoproteota archaeon]RDJ35933.1 MAG: hypothetical protein DWQ19_08595 [Thermoproteota archaeon]RDJ38510.1 MAG: hypothetical protein DWQ13_03830 [Thermoproteota archaeon]